MRCFWNSIYYNIRYFSIFGAHGMWADGHEYDEENAEIHGDHWHMKCVHCKATAATEVHPSKIMELGEEENE